MMIMIMTLLVQLTTTATVAAADNNIPNPEDDFKGYMEGMEVAKAEAAAEREMLERHQVRTCASFLSFYSR